VPCNRDRTLQIHGGIREFLLTPHIPSKQLCHVIIHEYRLAHPGIIVPCGLPEILLENFLPPLEIVIVLVFVLNVAIVPAFRRLQDHIGEFAVDIPGLESSTGSDHHRGRTGLH